MFSKTICQVTGIDPNKKIGLLNEEELKAIENTASNPQVPPWLLNRQKDPETGKNLHLTGSDLDLRRREDINIMRRIRCYKGVRHELGQPVRGQSTRSTFRTNKTVGVSKKAARMAKAPAPKAAPEKK
jgi:small subunit ribosomal protein S13